MVNTQSKSDLLSKELHASLHGSWLAQSTSKVNNIVLALLVAYLLCDIAFFTIDTQTRGNCNLPRKTQAYKSVI